jgi:signal transduction histidine kinase
MLDRRLMQRVVVNLLTNAREAITGPGEIMVGAEVRTTPAGPSLHLTVRDNGRGMSDDFVRTGLFKPFSTTKPTGLGVGLAQCKAIVEAHGGTIRVESRSGRGTTFAVDVPLPVMPSGDTVGRGGSESNDSKDLEASTGNGNEAVGGSVPTPTRVAGDQP